MRVHYLQHVPFEPLGAIEEWVQKKGYQLSGTHLYLNQNFPELNRVDLLVVLGGPMGVYDEDDYPFLREEKKFLEKALASDKIILGICLGAQLLADTLGAKIYRTPYLEIGWFPIQLTEWAKRSDLFRGFPEEFTPFHWHGETFELPKDANRIAFNTATENQGFIYGDRVLALQFHLETTPQSAELLIKNGQTDLERGGDYVQNPEEILSKNELFSQNNRLLFTLLDRLATVK